MKKFIKILVSAILSIAMLGCLTACEEKSDLKKIEEAGKIVVGITIYEPMDYIDAETGDWTGFDAELAREFAEELNVNCQFVIITWSQKAIELKSNQIDLIWNGMTATSALGKQIDFSVSYAKNAQVAVVKKGSTITTKAQIKTAQVAVESGSAGAIVAQQEGMVNVNAPGNQRQALLEVLADTSEVAIIDITMAQSVVGVGEFSDLQIVQGVSYGDEIFAVGLRKGSDLKAKLDAFLKAKYADGTITALAQTYNVGLNIEELSK
jgi:polar amino acid transport system substrate-binding protein